MKKIVYKLLWGIFVLVPGAMVINNYIKLYEITSIEYAAIFYSLLIISTIFLSEFAIDFLILRKHIYNYVLFSSIFTIVLVWFFNDFMPHFVIVNPQLSWIIGFSLMLGSWSQLAYKISKKI